MAHTLLVTRPFYDFTTSYLNKWNLNIIATAKKNNLKISDLEYKRSNRKELMSVIKKLNPDLIVLNGHGEGDRILGQDDEILIKVGDNEYILKNCVVYALSCRSAQSLGPSSIKAGAKAYIGYMQDFIFFTDNEHDTHPQLDPIAKLFLEPTNMIVDALISGNNPEYADEQGKKGFMKNIYSILSTRSSSEEYLARFLWWDMSNQVCLT